MRPACGNGENGIIEKLLTRPYWVIDLLPSQVPADGGGRFFAVEGLFREEPRRSETRRRFADVLLKLNCYHDLRVHRDDDELGELNPDPRKLEEWVLADSGTICIVVDGGSALILVPDDSTCMALYDPSPGLLERTRAIAAASGLFVWQPPQDPDA